MRELEAAIRNQLARACALALLLGTPLIACQDDDDDDDDDRADGSAAAALCADAGPAGAPAALEGVCATDAGPFTLDIDNPFFPLMVGSVHVLEGEEDGTMHRVKQTVLDETEQVAGVTTRVLEEREEEDGELIEVSRNFFAQAPDGTVCYFGEDVDIYEGGKVVDHEGAWRAGADDNRPGIVMPADPQLGMTYAQEIAIDSDAWDHASHVAEGARVKVPAGTFDDTIQTIEWTPIEPDDISRKTYARDVGMIVDDTLKLTSIE
jgi:hypothetical protein